MKIYGQRYSRPSHYEGRIRGTRFLFHKKMGIWGFFARHIHTHTRALCTHIHRHTHNTQAYSHNGRRFWMGARGLFRAPSSPRISDRVWNKRGEAGHNTYELLLFYLTFRYWIHCLGTCIYLMIDRALFHSSLWIERDPYTREEQICP